MIRSGSASALLLILLLRSSPPIEAKEQTESPPEMTTYYVGFLFRGPNWTPAVTAEIERIQKEHLANIRKMADSGKLILAGPFTDDGKLRGMFVFRVGSFEEATALAEGDPAVKAGRLVVEIHPWLSAKGIRVDQTAKETTMFHGLRTAIYHVADLERAKEWYSTALGIKPYFDQPFYVGFNVGGYELGLQPDKSVPSGKSAGVVAYWGVDNANVSLERILKLGAIRNEDVVDVGGGIRVASVVDPFGNIFGIIENPHFSPQSR